MKGRLSDNTTMQMTIINPPEVQEMNANENKETASSENGVQNQHASLEIQAVE